MIPADTLARVLTLRVDLRDEKACAEITPEAAATYLRAKGWELTLEREHVTLWNACGEFAVNVPREQSFADYGRRMCEAVTDLADAEQRSPLAVWVDMMGEKTA